MSILAITALALLITLTAAYLAGRHMSQSISTEIDIAASPAAVWTVLTDTQGYEDWNPFIRSFRGELTKGSQLEVSIQLAGQSPMAFKPRVLNASKDQELRWIGQMGLPGIFDGEHFFTLHETKEGTTRLHHGERFSGILTYPLLALIDSKTTSGFEAMNHALKTQVEGKG